MDSSSNKPTSSRPRSWPNPRDTGLITPLRSLRVPLIVEMRDRLVRIPGADTVESLNVSAAAAVLCWEFFRLRGNPGGQVGKR